MSVTEINPETRDVAECRFAVDGSTKIQSHHLERLAIVYVRQSTPQQVSDHRESTEVQYKLVHRAVAFGWQKDRVLVIDNDLGQSGSTAVNRVGFQRLLAEIGLNHVGLVLGMEMSRLARSCKDWYQLLELCAVFQSLLADQDGLYDPSNYNDRLLLGLKGTMSEAELHILRGRMEQGRRNKADRCELFYRAPIGYILLSSKEMVLDPDQQVQSVVHLIFEKFAELGSCRQLFYYMLENNIQIPVRPNCGPNRGVLEWHVVNAVTLYQILHHPIYAGAYSHGRTGTDPRRKIPGRRDTGRIRLPMNQWQSLCRNKLPAYITWEQFLANQRRLTQNRAGFETRGAPRNGSALLGGIVVCACCNWRMYVAYRDKPSRPRYVCHQDVTTDGSRRRPSIAARVVDELVVRQVLQALQPAALELSLAAEEDLGREQDRLRKHWHQQLERANYRTDRAKRQYDAVEPENRLVARELEQRWEQALLDEQRIKEEYARFQQGRAKRLSPSDREAISALASDIPALWNAPSTTFADRQTIIRHLVERIVIKIHGETEVVDVTIHWVGGFVSQHEIIRPVGRYTQLRDYDRLIARIVELREAGYTGEEIADRLNAEGFRSPKCDHKYSGDTVRQLFARIGRAKRHRGITPDNDQRAENEWWMEDLTQELGIPKPTLDSWCRKGWIHARKLTIAGRRWVIWADADELQRLRKLRACRRGGPRVPYPIELTTPKKRTE